MTLNEILESIGNRTVKREDFVQILNENAWEAEPVIKHLVKQTNLVPVDEDSFKVGDRFLLRYRLN